MRRCDGCAEEDVLAQVQERIWNIVFGISTVVITLVVVLPLATSKLFGYIWSWEGLILSYGNLKNKTWIIFLGILLLSVCIVLLIVYLPRFVWKMLLKAQIALQIKAKCKEKVFLLFALKPSTEKLELAFGKSGKPWVWKKSGKLRWVILCVAGVLAFAAFPHDIPLSARWFEKYSLVAHAGGTSPNGNVYSNSLEAFEYNYGQGHRVFEGDMCLTADGILVVEHDWYHWHNKMGLQYLGQPVTYEQFMQTPFYGTETPMDLAMLMDMMANHPDMYFMTDFKNCYEEDEVISGFQQILHAAEKANCVDVLDRFIIQNHHNQFKHWVDSVYPFENWLYTFYSILDPGEALAENLTAYCEEEHIPVVTMWDSMFNNAWLEYTRKHHLKIFVHTVNDISQVNEQLVAGVSGFYTDDIKPNQLE